MVISHIVDIVHQNGGRFLRWDSRSKAWVELSDKQAREKVGHAFRDQFAAHGCKEPSPHRLSQPSQPLELSSATSTSEEVSEPLPIRGGAVAEDDSSSSNSSSHLDPLDINSDPDWDNLSFGDLVIV